ncbi:MAG: DUF4258 domain-containing protein [Balneolaceae bacterium]|nr:DUF4258 domain-containing protein [Balneolaceae bacterium]
MNEHDNLEFSNHATARCAARGIRQEEIIDAIQNHDRVINESDCKRIYQKVFTQNNNRLLLRVFVNRCKKPMLIITAYKTSKLDKYEY